MFNQKIELQHPSISIISQSKTHMAFSAQLLYPYWHSYVRNTLIYCFRPDENSPWRLIVLPENDRFTYNAKQESRDDFEQRYFKHLSGKPGIMFTEGKTRNETANNAFNAFVQCYPKDIQNIPKDAETLIKYQFKTSFSELTTANFQNKENPNRLSPMMQRSEKRAMDTVREKKLTVTDNSTTTNATTEIIDTNYTKVTFGEITFHLYKEGKNIIAFADYNGLNCLDGGMLRLNADLSQWEKQIKESWLMQQMNVYLGRVHNPETQNAPPYKIVDQIPLATICNAAFNLKESMKVQQPQKLPKVEPTKIRTNGVDVIQKSIDPKVQKLINKIQTHIDQLNKEKRYTWFFSERKQHKIEVLMELKKSLTEGNLSTFNTFKKAHPDIMADAQKGIFRNVTSELIDKAVLILQPKNK